MHALASIGLVEPMSHSPFGFEEEKYLNTDNDNEYPQKYYERAPKINRQQKGDMLLFSWSHPMNVLVRHWDRGGVGLLPNL